MKRTINITHWDADGVVSSVLISKAKNLNPYVIVPETGNFFLSDKKKKEIKELNPEKIIVTDMSIPESDILFLKSIADVEIYDHHHGEKIEGVFTVNPVINGKSQKEYPSCSKVIVEHFKLKEDVLLWAGVWGDIGFKIKEYPRLKKALLEFLKKIKIKESDFFKFVETIDSQHKADKGSERVLKTIDFLLKNEPLSIIKDESFTNVISTVEKKFNEIYSSAIQFNNVNIIIFDEDYYLVSKLCRQLFKEHPEMINIVIGIREDFINFYIRSRIINFSSTIKKLKSKGYFAGGKDDVLGVVSKKEEFFKIINELSELFDKTLKTFIIKVLKNRF